MARRPATPDLPPDDLVEKVVDIDVAAEMEGSFLEYAYSVIYSRALPDARDGSSPCSAASCSRCPTWACGPNVHT